MVALFQKYMKESKLSVASQLACAYCLLADISTECSSRHQGDDDWSIQSKRRQVIFQAIVGNR